MSVELGQRDGNSRVRRRVLTVVGTRPEAIKMAPVIKALRASRAFDSALCATGQHQTMLNQVFDLFDIKPDFDLAIMKQDQTLADITNGVLNGVSRLIAQWRPDVVLVHGDTTSALAAALALAKPVLVMRDLTERPEALQSGIVRLVGADESRIIAATAALLDDSNDYAQAARGGNPFGDGHASERIVAALTQNSAKVGENQ